MHLTAVHVALHDAPGQELDGDKGSNATVSLGHYSTFGELARRIAELRLASKQVILDLSP